MNWNSSDLSHIGHCGIQSKKYDINGISPFICRSVKSIIFKCIFLHQICLDFTSIFYFEIFKAFKFPIQLFVTLLLQTCGAPCTPRSRQGGL